MRPTTSAVGALLLAMPLLVAGCRFPDQCQTYPGEGASSAQAASREGSGCQLTLKYQGRVYTLQTGALVTDVGEPIEDPIEVQGCSKTREDDPAVAGESAPVGVFTVARYCASDALAVELEDGEQLRVFRVTESEEWVLP